MSEERINIEKERNALDVGQALIGMLEFWVSGADIRFVFIRGRDATARNTQRRSAKRIEINHDTHTW